MNDLDSCIRVVIVDDHPWIREGLRTRLSMAPGLNVVGVVASGAEALSLADAEAPDLMLVDIGMRHMNGIELTMLLRKQHPSVHVVMLSMYDEREYVVSSIRAGARGYVVKGAPTEELLAAINAVCAGGSYFTTRVVEAAREIGCTDVS